MPACGHGCHTRWKCHELARSLRLLAALNVSHYTASVKRHQLFVAATAAVAYACSSQSATPPVASSFGVFGISVSPDNARLTVSGPGGAPLVDGIAASSGVGASASANDDAPPMTGFAVRDVTTQYKMLFGAFDITDSPNAAWRVAQSARWTGGAAPVELVDGSGSKLATLSFSTPDDPNHLVVDVEPGDGPERRFSWGFQCAADDHFLGFGAQTWGADARGETLPLWTSEEGVRKDLTTDDPVASWFIEGRRHSSYMPLPEFLSSRGYFAVAETNNLSTFSMCGERSDVARMQLQMPVKVHLFYGPAPTDAITRMTAIFGRPRVPPAFAFAPWNDAIFGSANVRRVAKELRDIGIPSSVIWTEDWRGGQFVSDGPGGAADHYQLKEEWDVDRTLYPDFEAVASELHGEGFKWLVYFNSFVEKQSKAWPETAPSGFLIQGADGQPDIFADATFADASMVDLSNPAAVKWAVGKMQAAIALGADGWMGDFSEWLPTDAKLTAGSGLDLHSQYPILWQQAQRQALDGVSDGVERLDFVRSGWFGTPPLVDVWWPGDQQTDWGQDDGMPTVIPVGLGVSLGGISTFGSDIAGYQDLNSTPSTKELFFRWAELGALSPVMRTHHGSYPKLNWSFESDGETLAHWARYAKLHIALAPYLRTLAQAAHDTGISIMRPLAVQFPNDLAAWPVADEYMLGPAMLVAPVLVQGALGRNVYLPQGRWYRWDGGPAISGGTISVAAPITEIPILSPAGAIVPTYPDGVMTLTKESSSAANAASAGDDRIVYVFSGANGSFVEANGGPSFTLTTLDTTGNATAAAASWNGVPLVACNATAPVAPCFQTNANSLRAYVIGAGTLTLASVATLDVKTAVPGATFQLVIR
jgi:sulfoquinovosidase